MNKFESLIAEKPALKEKINAAGSADAAWKLIEQELPGYSQEEFAADLKSMKEASAELSEDQLSAVAGGVSTDDIYISDADFFEGVFGIFGKLFKLFK